MELAALAVSAALAAGAVSGACIVWLVKRNWMAAAGALFIGALIGVVVVRPLMSFVSRAPNGDTTVVKVGSASLSRTIPAGMLGSVTSGMAVAVLAILAFGATDQAATLFGVAVGSGTVIGLLFACLSSLT